MTEQPIDINSCTDFIEVDKYNKTAILCTIDITIRIISPYVISVITHFMKQIYVFKLLSIMLRVKLPVIFVTVKRIGLRRTLNNA